MSTKTGAQEEEDYEAFEKDDYEEACICNSRGEKHCSANVRAVLEIAVQQNSIITHLKAQGGGGASNQVSEVKLEEIEQQSR